MKLDLEKSSEKLIAHLTTAPGRYDLPLPKSMGSGFLVLLVALMTCLSVFAATGGLVLSDISNRWSSGLQTSLTIEIPSSPNNAETTAHAALVAEVVAGINGVKSATPLAQSDLKNLLSPWMGSDSRILDNAPLPGIVSVELQRVDAQTIDAISAKTKSISPHATIDRHEDWLSHVLRLAGSLKFASYLLVLVITITTITAVAGAVRAQMAAFHEQIEILHIMGATDRYISHQFARHGLFLGLRGGTMGCLCAFAFLLVINLWAGAADMALLPDFTLGWGWALLALMPALACVLVTATAYFTVHRTLQALP